MTNRRTILWEYWQNPYGGYGEEFVGEDEAKVPETPWEQKERDESKEVSVRPVIPTSMGLMPVQPFRNFTEVFEFWIGHTNFYITEDVKEAIEFNPGVEIFELFSPYRFRVCVGKAFKGSEVKHNIQACLGALPPKKTEINPMEIKLDKDTEEKVLLIQDDIKDKFEYWSIYVMPNGEIDVSGSNTPEGYKTQLELYGNALKMVGGVIYSYA